MSTIKLSDCEHVVEASDANLAESVFEDVRLAGVRFAQVTFEGSKFVDSHLDGCVFTNVSLAGVTISDSHLDGLVINGIEIAPLIAAAHAGLQPS